MPATLILQRVLVRDMPDRSRIVATLRVEQLEGNADAHFSATAMTYEPRGTHSGAVRARMGRDADGFGCMHGEILAAFPGAAPFVAMHLSSAPAGTPMHAEANARYFLSGAWEDYNGRQYGKNYADRHGSGIAAAVRLLRLQHADDLPAWTLEAHATRRPWTDAELVEWLEFIDAQAMRWCAQARAAVELLQMMPDSTDLRGYDMHGEPVERRALPAWLIGSDPELVDI